MFAVAICLFDRSGDPFFQIPHRTLEAVAAQTHPDWFVYVRGDGLNDEAVSRAQHMLRSSNIAGRFSFENLPESTREKHHLESESVSEREFELWALGGTHCYNSALDAIVAASCDAGSATAPHCHTHFARLDDDDLWHPTHLQWLAVAYQLVPEATFVHTRGEQVRDQT